MPMTSVRRSEQNRRRAGDVVGTANAVLGYRVRSGSSSRVEKQRHENNAEEKQRETRERERSLVRSDFKKETDRKIRCRTVHQRMREGMAQYEEKLNARRERLRDLLAREEGALTKEIADRASRDYESRIGETRARADQLRKEREEQREALAAAKRMQQYLARCQEFREKQWKENVADAKYCNLVQIAENRARREAEKELETLWHEVMLKEIAAKEERDAEEAKKRFLRDKDRIAALEKQVASGKLVLEERKKQAQKEEREHLERLWENVRLEELRNLERERKRREALKKDLEEQIVRAKRFLAERAREEATAERIFSTLAQEELARERKKQRRTTESLRRELLAYLRYLEELRAEEARRNIEVDAIIEQSVKEGQARRELATRRFKEARAKYLQEVLRARDEQVRAKRESQEIEKREREAERISLEKDIEERTKLLERQQEECRIRALRYRDDLMKQQEYVEAAKKRDAAEEERIYRDARQQEEEYQKLTEELLKASENITPHPFKVILKESYERRNAEKEGRFYCPPPLPPE